MARMDSRRTDMGQWGTIDRIIGTPVQFLKSNADQTGKKKAPRGAFAVLRGSAAQSLLPPPMPSSISKLWNTLYMLRYKP
ncbi:MAG: hypothetical protein ABIR55_20420, partial [Burkholderiaceae bacterium]